MERDPNPSVEMLEALGGLIGLVQLVLARDDIPPAVREALTTSHRYETAIAVHNKHR